MTSNFDINQHRADITNPNSSEQLITKPIKTYSLEVIKRYLAQRYEGGAVPSNLEARLDRVKEDLK